MISLSEAARIAHQQLLDAEGRRAECNRIESEFYRKLYDSQIDIPPAFAKVINDNFWSLL